MATKHKAFGCVDTTQYFVFGPNRLYAEPDRRHCGWYSNGVPRFQTAKIR